MLECKPICSLPLPTLSRLAPPFDDHQVVSMSLAPPHGAPWRQVTHALHSHPCHLTPFNSSLSLSPPMATYKTEGLNKQPDWRWEGFGWQGRIHGAWAQCRQGVLGGGARDGMSHATRRAVGRPRNSREREGTYGSACKHGYNMPHTSVKPTWRVI
jgi:hypothetical protein